jgi:hypothetical protein
VLDFTPQLQFCSLSSVEKIIGQKVKKVTTFVAGNRKVHLPHECFQSVFRGISGIHQSRKIIGKIHTGLCRHNQTAGTRQSHLSNIRQIVELDRHRWLAVNGASVTGKSVAKRFRLAY